MTDQNNIILISDETQIAPVDISLTDLLLPDQWIVYLYDKQLFKKVANKQNFQAEPYRAVCTINTVNDLINLLQLMKLHVPANHGQKNKNMSMGGPGAGSSRSGPSNMIEKINLDMNDYIIMRKGIEPIWEDPRNKNGGTFSVKIDHARGYDVWSTFMIYILGETLTQNMNTINGISVSYISDTTNINTQPVENSRVLPIAENKSHGYTFIKIWDGKQDRDKEKFMSILPEEIISQIKNDSIRYTFNNQKNDYNESINSKINGKKYGFENKRGGFRSQSNRGGGGYRR